MNYKIMVVDDDEGIMDLARDALENFGYTVFCAEDGEKALEVLKEEEDIHVFIIDLQLPGMNGVELCYEIRKSDPISTIYAITGYATNEGLVLCRKVGFDDYFSKPFDVKMFIDIVHFAFDRLRRWEGYG